MQEGINPIKCFFNNLFKMAYLKKLEAKFTRERVKDDLLGKAICSSRQAYALFRSMEDETKEKLVTVHLNAHLKILSYEVTAIGGIDQVLADPREIYTAALLARADSIILIHNHVSGDPEPSPNDKKQYKALTKAGELLNILISDFIIIGEKAYFSFVDAGLF